MAEIIKKGKRTIMKFNKNIKNFRRIEKLVYGKLHFKLYIDKNDSVYDVKECIVSSWKTVEKGKKKVTVPDSITEQRNIYFFDRVKGNPSKIAANKILAILEYQ